MGPTNETGTGVDGSVGGNVGSSADGGVGVGVGVAVGATDTPSSRLLSRLILLRRRASTTSIDSTALMISGGLNAALGMVYWIIATRFYPVDQVGRASTLISVGMVISTTAILASGQMLERFLPALGHRRGRAIALVLTQVTLLATALTTAFVIFGDNSTLLPQLYQRFLYIIAVTTLALFAVSDSILIGLHVGRWAAAKNMSHAIIKLVALAIIGMLTLPNTSFTAWVIMGTWILPAALLVVIIQPVVLRRLANHARAAEESGLAPSAPIAQSATSAPSEPSAQSAQSATSALPPRRELVAYYGTSVAWMIGQVLPGFLIPVLIAHQLGLASAAFFNSSWVIVAASHMLISMAGGPFVAQLSRPADELSPAQFRAHTITFIKLIMGVSVLRFVGVALLGPIALYLYGSEYAAGGTTLLILMGCAHAISGPAYIYGSLAKVYRHIAYPMVTQLAGAVLLVTLVIWWLPSDGINAIGWAYIVHDIAILLAALIPLRMLLRKALAGELP